MAIAALQKVTFYGSARDKQRAIAGLQDLGCVHLLPLSHPDTDTVEGLPSGAAREALRFLETCPGQLKQMHPGADFDPAAVQRAALDVKQRMAELRDEIDFLRARSHDLEPWGDFEFSDIAGRGGYRLWFYKVPHHKLRFVLEQEDLIYEEVHRDQRFCYIAVVAREEPAPDAMPVERTHTGDVPLSELQRRLEEAEAGLEDQRVERYKLTRWATALAGSLASLEDQVARANAELHAHSDAGLFAIRGWAPQPQLDAVRAFAAEHGLAVEAAPPAEGEEPPTLLHNPAPVAAGENLVTFYVTPDYRTWDPSAVVFVSFTLFFAMILGDAGYAGLLGLVLLLFWRKMGRSPLGGRMRRLLTAVVLASLAWGVLVGGYFGVAPPPGSPLATLHVFDVSDFDMMMPLSISIGVAHILLANFVELRRLRGSPMMFVPLGWMATIVGGVLLSLGAGTPALEPVGWAVFGAGLGCVFLFSKPEAGLAGRVFGGLAGLTRITGAFGDILSYLRLFALGLASSALAMSFNDLAGQAAGAAGGFGFLLAGLVLVIGHLLNFVLCIMSGVVHGLRLNFIEFFNWSLAEEGSPFRPFHRKEQHVWKQSPSH
jgi:V/A-type H+-transporting ATPase subunit I